LIEELTEDVLKIKRRFSALNEELDSLHRENAEEANSWMKKVGEKSTFVSKRLKKCLNFC